MRWILLHVTLLLASQLVAQVPCNAVQADFTWSSTPSGTQFAYSPSVAGAVYTYHWSFGDGHTSSLPTPFHTYGAAGTYEVCLTVTVVFTNSTTPCTVTACHPVNWNGPPPTNVCDALEAGFTWTGTASGAIGIVSFTNTTTGTGQQTNWHWTFGDGHTSTAQHPVHTYAAAGTYEVCLTVVTVHYNSNGTTPAITCTDTYCTNVTVQPSSNNCSWLTAGFTWTGTPNGVQFHYTPPVAGAVYTYLWTFANGYTSTEQNPFVTINASFTSEVCLTVTAQSSNTSGICTATSCQDVTWVVPAPCTGYAVAISTGPATNPMHHTFWATPTPWTEHLAWDFGDGTTGTGPQVGHTFPGPGVYTVCVTATWPANTATGICTATSCTTVTVTGGPGACDPGFAITVEALPNTPAGAYVLQATTNIPAGGIHWTLGNGTVVQGHLLQVNNVTNVAMEICVHAWYLPAGASDTCWTSMCGDLQTFLSATAISEHTADQPVLVAYPNPVSDVLTITWTGVQAPAIVRLFSADGRLEREITGVGSPFTMDAEGLAPGLYILHVQAVDGQRTVRVMVQ